MTIIVDTSVWIDFFSGKKGGKNLILKSFLEDDYNIVSLTDLILCEILQGIKDPFKERRIRQILLTIPVYPCTGVDLAIQSASNYRKLRSKGITVRNTIDCLIATFAISKKYPLLHNDKDFLAFEEHLGLTQI